jgi:hypothetical protein
MIGRKIQGTLLGFVHKSNSESNTSDLSTADNKNEAELIIHLKGRKDQVLFRGTMLII